MADEQKSVLQVLIELVDRVSEPLQEVNENFEQFSESAHGWWTAAAEVFAGYEALSKFTEPAIAMAEAQARLGLAGKFSAEQLAAFKEQAEDLADVFPKNAEDITAAQTELYKTLGNVEKTKEATEIATRLATVLGINATEAATVLASTYENLGDKTKPVTDQMQEVADKLSVLTTLFPTSGMGASRMAMEMSRLGEVAATYGIKQNQVFATLAEMNKLHVGGQRGAGMVLQELIQSLGELDSHGIPTLAKYGLVLEKDRAGNLHFIATLERMAKMQPAALQSLLQRFHGQGQAIALALQHLPEIEEDYRKFEASGGALNDAATALANTPQAKLERLKDTVANLADTIGTQTLPQIIHIVSVLDKWVTKIDEFLTKHPAFAKAVGDVTLGLGGLLTLSGIWKFGSITVGLIKLTGELLKLPEILGMIRNAWTAGTLAAEAFAGGEGIGAVGTALSALFESNPVGWIITLIAALAIGAYEVYKHWDKVVEVFHEIRDAAAELFNFLEHSTGLDKLHFLADLLGGNIGAAAVDMSVPTVAGGSSIAASSAQQIHYNPQVTVNVGPGVDPADAAAAFHGVLQGHASEFGGNLAEQQRRENRLSFRDTTNPFFAR